MSDEAYDKRVDRVWTDLQSHVSQMQDGKGGWPDGWLTSRMSPLFDVAHLTVAGEDVGYFFYLKAQSGKMRNAMKGLLGNLAVLDQEIADHQKTKALLAAASDQSGDAGRVRELEARVAELESQLAAKPQLIRLQSDHQTPILKATPPLIREVSMAPKGEAAYALRADGLRWVEINEILGVPRSQDNAKAYAKAKAKQWPPTQNGLSIPEPIPEPI